MPPILAVDSGLNKYMRSVFTRMFFAMCITGCIAFTCASNQKVMEVMGGGLSTIMMFITIGIVIYISARINKISSNTANTLFWVYSALIGFSLSPLCFVYTGESIANAFFMTSSFFGGMSLLGYTTKRDLTGVGSFMTMGLWCLIITSLINMFIGSSTLQLGLSAITIVIFAGLTAYDVQKIKTFYNPADGDELSNKKAVLGALTLYLDFLNMFIAILRFVGNRK